MATPDCKVCGQAAETVDARKPFTHLDLDITERCNLGCHYCYKSDMQGASLDEDLAMRIMDWFTGQAPQKGRLSVQFMGGEPLVEWELIQRIVSRYKEQLGDRLRFGLTSNLTMLNAEIACWMKRHEMNIHCSIDGCRSSHDMHRVDKQGKGTYDRAVANVEYALMITPGDTARYTVTPDALQYMAEGTIGLLDLGFHGVAPVPVVMDELWDEQKYFQLTQQMELVADWFIVECKKLKGGARLPYIKWIHDAIEGANGRTVRTNPCGAGRSMIAVDVLGRFWPCHRFTGVEREPDPRVYLGSVDDGVDWEVRATYQTDVRRERKCWTCPGIFHCGTQCRAEVFLQCSTIEGATESFCYFRSECARFADYIQSQLEHAKCEAFRRRYGSMRGRGQRRGRQSAQKCPARH